MSEEKSNEALMLEYRNGNADAFVMLYESNKTPLYRYFLRQTHKPAEAEELAQDVWTKIIQARERYSVQAKFTTYLYQIAHNHLVDHFRRQSVRPVESTDDYQETPFDNVSDMTTPQPDQYLERARMQKKLRSLIVELPLHQRETFLLKEEVGLSIKDIAAITGVSHETVKSRMRYANGKLREQLGLELGAAS